MTIKLDIKDVSQVYKDKVALNKVNLSLTNGIYGLVGPNGAGKTTLINVIVGILHPTQGEVYFNGENIHKNIENYLSHIGYLPQYPHFYDEFTCLDFLNYMSELKGLNSKEMSSKIEELLDLCNLSQDANRKIKGFSGGMKQRLGIAQALLNDPQILILDEPTAGLDPKERMHFRNIISKLSVHKIIILATHILEDIESVANKVILIKNGEIIDLITTEDLLSKINNQIWEIKVNEDELETIEKSRLITRIFNDQGQCYIRYIGEALENSYHVTPKLEEVYIYYFGN
ncbi:MAG: ABC transporter ATP-binding protein [Longibaculum sp.]